MATGLQLQLGIKSRDMLQLTASPIMLQVSITRVAVCMCRRQPVMVNQVLRRHIGLSLNSFHPDNLGNKTLERVIPEQQVVPDMGSRNMWILQGMHKMPIPARQPLHHL